MAKTETIVKVVRIVPETINVKKLMKWLDKLAAKK